VTADLASSSLSTDQLLRDLCGIKGTVLASFEAVSSPQPSNGALTAIKAELDSVRSLLWLRLHASKN
jgi:hypothetical protein